MDTIFSTRVIFLVFSCGFVTGLSPGPMLDGDFESMCSLRCPFQNKTEENYDAGCGMECKILQCTRGCNLWRKSLESSCPAVCNGTQVMLTPKELHCVLGCNGAINQYFQKLKDDIGVPPAPYLVADTLTATSLSLAWEGKKYLDMSYLVQWRYEEHAGAWQYCRNQTWGPTSVVLVDNLQPFTKYRFRVALLLSQHSEPIVSRPSVVISTLASGPPTSAPLIVRASSVDSKRISISWKPGPFPNGPIHSYVLQLVGEHIAFKEDVPATLNSDFYMFQNLNANSKYLVSVAMRNAVGEGPAAMTEIQTSPEPLVKNTPQPILILGSRRRVIKQRADMLSPSEVIYDSSYDITGIAIHVKKNLLFVSDMSGYVTAASLRSSEPPQKILSPEDMSFQPLDLSVDWLNQHVYILGELVHEEGPMWQVSRCGFDGRGLTVAVAAITTRPIHIEVDPYNGYLFWLTQGHTRGGLYRLDLATISNGIKHEVIPDIILERPNLGAFVVDHTNFCVLVPSQENNTVYSVSLDGRETVDVRSNTQQALFRNVTSLALANGLFFWTNGDEVFTEDYHEGQQTYFHNHYPGLTERSYISIAVDLPASQPTPVPINPPIHAQAVLGDRTATINWQVPHLVGGQGKGAWQNWSYELQVKEVDTGEVITQNEIANTTYCKVDGLFSNTEYNIKVAAYTSSGIGPWSTEFRGRTLRTPANGQYPTILWSAAEGLLQSGVTGEHEETLIASENMKEQNELFTIVSIAWLEDMIYMVSNTSRLYWYNISAHTYGRMWDVESVSSIAVDWIGKRLYWSNPKQQIIVRASAEGGTQEPLPILTMAKELSVDSLHAFIYWSTGHAVECARLNGESRTVYYPAQLFSGRHVMGLTLNTDDRHAYWIVRSSEGSVLYNAPMMDTHAVLTQAEVGPRSVATLQHADMQGPLCYFSDRLLWLQDARNAVIAGLNGQNAATVTGVALSALNTVAVMDTSARTSPGELVAIPEPVQSSSIQVVGSWSDFNITWDPVTNVNFGEVFYEVTVMQESNEQRITTTRTVMELTNVADLPPYARLKISIKPFTYWGSSAQVSKVVHSPPSRPSAPTNVRVFVQQEADIALAILRWSFPERPNGVMIGYNIRCWHFAPKTDQATQDCGNAQVLPETKEFTIRNLAINTTYYFQVQGVTEAGEGELSKTVSGDASRLRPVPRLVLATADHVRILDCDTRQLFSLTSAVRPVDITWNDHEKTIYWLSALKEIYRINYDGTNKTKIITLRGNGLSLTVDWVARCLYWSEMEDSEMTSSIHRLDLNQLGTDGHISERIVHRNRRIHELKVSPLSGALFWVEVNRHGAGHLMRSSTEGTAMHTLFSVHIDPNRRTCSCPENPRVGTTLSLDQTDPYNPQILYSDDNQGNIYTTGPYGCYCSIILKAHGKAIPSSLTTDHHHTFWSNEAEGKIYMADENELIEIDQPGVTRIRAIGSHLQSMPSKDCLIIPSQVKEPRVLEVSSREIVLELPRIQKSTACENVTTASTQYTLHYGIITEGGYTDCTDKINNNCNELVTYHTTVRINQLRPFSNYIFRLTLKNYYTDVYGLSLVRTEPTVVKTSAGAPSRARAVTVTVLTPTLINVEWLPPTEFNDRAVSYEVHWKTEGIVAGMRQSGEFVVGEVETTEQNTSRSVHVRKLIPGQLYQVWVRTYSENSEYFSDSEPIEVDTYPLPSNITLAQATPYSLEVFWSPPRQIASEYCLQYYDFNIGEWTNISKSIEDISFTRYFVESLMPKTIYLFRTVTMYEKTDTPYIWPLDARFSYETLGDRPSRPGTPVVQHLRRGVYQVLWESSRENGAHIELYLLEGQESGHWRRRREANYTTISEISNSIDGNDWKTYYNGTDNYWIINDLSTSLKYLFRVRGRNRYGWSDASETSELFDYTEASLLADQQELGIVLGITVPIAVLLCVVGSILFCCLFKRKEKEKKDLQVLTLATNNRLPDVELATLRELPRRGNFVANANLLYAAAEPPTDEQLALLPHIRREQFKLTKFLGSGAFGEVYEGVTNSLPGTEGTTKVAIKALRKGASDQEKCEFLKEAQLMSHFKHEHILQLVGVCLDNDPNYILMELMEGGDLLSYLRANRPLISNRSGMKLTELLDMCVDVASGCRYLEDMHFVHRDLACRNCLVSSLDPARRVVKIGDFGLARDIYKNDYYRKEGEGLLPVRWMAPESLVDGVFTSQSDVWSFGVLLWEIMTLGQQPYPARNNIEVLHYVRTGGRLGKPGNCSEQLHELMLKCWSYRPDSRPTFKYCLEVLTSLKEQKVNSLLTPHHSGTAQYIQVRTGKTPGTENEAYDETDSGDDTSGQSWKEGERSSTEAPYSCNEVTPTPHAYLQLLYEDDPHTQMTGYEVPRTRASSCVSPVPATAPLLPLPPPGAAPCIPPPTPETSTSSAGSQHPFDSVQPPSLPPDLSSITRIFDEQPVRLTDNNCNN